MNSTSGPAGTVMPPLIAFVGGADIDARLDLMRYLDGEFTCIAVGASSKLKQVFSDNSFEYHAYTLGNHISPLQNIATIYELARLLRRLHPQIVHTFDTKPGVLGRLAALLARVPIVIGTLPGLGELYASESFITRLVRNLYQPLQKLASHISDLTIFQNHDDALQFISAGVVPEKKAAIVTGSGIRTDVFDPAKFSAAACLKIRADLGIPPDHLVVTMISRLIRSKGVIEFAIASQRVRKSSQNVSFLLVGSLSPGKSDGFTPVEMSLINRFVILTGARKDIPAILASTDIFVLPSFYREGIPRVLLEASSMGLPLVATDMPGCREVVEHCVNGYLIPPQNADALAKAILQLARDSDTRQRFGETARRLAIEKFQFEIVASQMRTIYKQLLANKGLL